MFKTVRWTVEDWDLEKSRSKIMVVNSWRLKHFQSSDPRLTEGGNLKSPQTLLGKVNL